MTSCDDEFGSRDRHDSFAEAAAFLTGTWTLCREQLEPDVSGVVRRSLGEHDGLEFAREGRFHLLFAREDGTLERRTGLDYEGAFSQGLNGPDSMFLSVDNGRTPQALLVGSACPARLRLQLLAGPTQIYEYARSRE